MKWLLRITWLYLLIPFIIFCMGWLRLMFAIPLALFMVWVLWRLWQSAETMDALPRVNIVMIILAGLWVFSSGVGGYAFQNWDHHWRNAVFRDLITYDWPVAYSTPEQGPIKMLIYYVGYWLPAALAGKLLGWKFANFILLLWTWLGVILTILHLNRKLNISQVMTMLLLILFSGMDALGALLFAREYPTLWPPIQHLEIWSGDLQYSSFSTQLFWVFNQAVPAWLCSLLIINGSKREQAALAWGLCFFLAPLASIGLLPYLFIEWFQQTRANLPDPFKGMRFEFPAAAGLIVFISYIFFSSNSAAQERGLQDLPLAHVIVFFLLEGGLIWLILAQGLWRDPRWAATGILLFIMPFIQFGSGHDFVMRASIAPLFFLMVRSGELVFQNTTARFYRIALISMLSIGALTPLYEIDRSIQRTFEYYFLMDGDQTPVSDPGPITHLEQAGAPEAEHPHALVADEIQTLAFMTDKLSKNFIANVRQSLYYRFVAPH
jgi:hypothetical protein